MKKKRWIWVAIGAVVLGGGLVAARGRDKADPKDKDKRDKPKVLQKVTITKRRDGPAQGDNSNSQYAALGLRACHDAGIDLPGAVVDKAIAWWKSSGGVLVFGANGVNSIGAVRPTPRPDQ